MRTRPLTLARYRAWKLVYDRAYHARRRAAGIRQKPRDKALRAAYDRAYYLAHRGLRTAAARGLSDIPSPAGFLADAAQEAALASLEGRDPVLAAREYRKREAAWQARTVPYDDSVGH